MTTLEYIRTNIDGETNGYENTTDRKKLDKCWACERDTDTLIRVFRPLLSSDDRTEEMECVECSRLSDIQYIKNMNEKWDDKINEEMGKEFYD